MTPENFSNESIEQFTANAPMTGTESSYDDTANSVESLIDGAFTEPDEELILAIQNADRKAMFERHVTTIERNVLRIDMDALRQNRKS